MFGKAVCIMVSLSPVVTLAACGRQQSRAEGYRSAGREAQLASAQPKAPPRAASPMPAFNVWDLLEDSDEVWRGQVGKVVPGRLETRRVLVGDVGSGREVQGQWMTAGFRIDRVIKGTEGSRHAEIHFFTIPPEEYGSSMYGSLTRGEYIVVFLCREDNQLVFTRSFYPKFPIFRPAMEVPSRASSPEAALADELVRTLRAEQQDLVVLALQQLARLRFANIAPNDEYLVSLEDIASQIEWLSSSEAPVVRGQALGTVIALGQAQFLPALIEFLRTEPADRAMEQGQILAATALASVHPVVMQDIAAAYAQSTGAELASALNPFLRHKSAEVRHQTVVALHRLIR